MDIQLPISKSVANRLQILGRDVLQGIPALDIPQDVLVMYNALHSQEEDVNLYNCGTAMRFLTAYFALTPCRHTLLCDYRMSQRPIAPLVDALRQLGAEIEYAGINGYPPLRIAGKHLKGGVVELDGKISSQFTSALMLCSHLTDNGITIRHSTPCVSRPYIELTQAIIDNPDYPVESDWSAAAFWYEYVAINDKQDITLKNLRLDSKQGDKVVADIFRQLGVETQADGNDIRLVKTQPSTICLQCDFSHCPDLYPAVVATCYALRIKTHFSGIDTLQYKESNRIVAMQQALMEIENRGQNIIVDSHNDHRIAMALAMLNTLYGNMTITNPECVGKSYPRFWQQYEPLYEANEQKKLASLPCRNQ